jgi:CheY-like chemotaxis protein
MMTERAMKALVLVDDDADLVELVVLALRVLQVQRSVAAFTSGAECIAAIERGAVVPGLVVLDVNMPELDGPATARRIRAVQGMAAVPIVMLSTSDLKVDQQASHNAGANAYVLKPMLGRTWRDVIRDVMAHWADD